LLKKIILFMLLMSLNLYAIPPLKTGQTISCDSSGNVITDGTLKDDGFYQKGTIRSYSRNGDIVIDMITQLQWQDDNVTQRPWITQSNYAAGDFNDTSGETATTYCSDLQLGGYEDWRLPRIAELETLIDIGESVPALSVNVFKSQSSTLSLYWSSETSKSSDIYAIALFNAFGKIRPEDKTRNLLVRCVRGNYERNSNFSRSAEVVNDEKTMLQWQDTQEAKTVNLSWTESIDYCEALKLNGENDWRLPNINELLSIIDYAQSTPAIHTIFQNVAFENPWYWSSSSPADSHSMANYVPFEFAYRSRLPKGVANTYTYTNYVRCVRGGTTNSSTLKTGQDKSYDASGNEVTDGSVKDDGFYQEGTTPSYYRSDNGVIADIITGLQWQDNEVIKKRWITEENYNNGNINDTSGDTAINYCQDLILGDSDDWRLPSMQELKTIVHNGKYPPVIDATFKQISFLEYWTSTAQSVHAEDYAWTIDFYYGASHGVIRKYEHYIRCVRGKALQQSNFSRHNDIVSDSATYLQWQDDAAVKTIRKSWIDAVDYCQTLTTGGKDDWRLPNNKELHTLMKYTSTSPTIDTSVFQNYYPGYYWSSTSYFSNRSKALHLSFHDGFSHYEEKSYRQYIRCVRKEESDSGTSDKNIYMLPIMINYLLH